MAETIPWEGKGLYDALLAVQAEAPTLQKTALNPHFKSKYVPLNELHEAVIPLLTKHGLVWTCAPSLFVGSHPTVTPTLMYRLMHVPSGESIENSMMLMLDKNNPQGQGSAITYARRYALMTVLGLVADEDDDGNKATARPEKKERVASPRIPRDRALAIRDKSQELIRNRGLTITAFRAILASHGVDKIGELNVDQAEQVEEFLNG